MTHIVVHVFVYRRTFRKRKKASQVKITEPRELNEKTNNKTCNPANLTAAIEMTSKEERGGGKTARDSSVKTALMDAKKELKCGLCSDKFVDPRLLSCLHTFCFNCLRRYIDKGKFKACFACPLCNRKIDIPKGGVKVNYTKYICIRPSEIQKSA